MLLKQFKFFLVELALILKFHSSVQNLLNTNKNWMLILLKQVQALDGNKELPILLTLPNTKWNQVISSLLLDLMVLIRSFNMEQDLIQATLQ